MALSLGSYRRSALTDVPLHQWVDGTFRCFFHLMIQADFPKGACPCPSMHCSLVYSSSFIFEHPSQAHDWSSTNLLDKHPMHISSSFGQLPLARHAPNASKLPQIMFFFVPPIGWLFSLSKHPTDAFNWSVSFDGAPIASTECPPCPHLWSSSLP
jgi:hypothetical protein